MPVTTLTARRASTYKGIYPGSTNYPGATRYPGRGRTLEAISVGFGYGDMGYGDGPYGDDYVVLLVSPASTRHGLYPGPTNYPGATRYPGRGRTLAAKAA